MISLGLQLDLILKAIILNMQNHNHSNTHYQEEAWSASNTHKHTEHLTSGVQVQADAEVKGLGNVHSAFLECVTMVIYFHVLTTMTNC